MCVCVCVCVCACVHVRRPELITFSLLQYGSHKLSATGERGGEIECVSVYVSATVCVCVREGEREK